MSFVKSLWGFVKAHPVGSAVTFLLIVPLLAGGIALTIYRSARSAIVGAVPSVGGVLPEK